MTCARCAGGSEFVRGTTLVGLGGLLSIVEESFVVRTLGEASSLLELARLTPNALHSSIFLSLGYVTLYYITATSNIIILQQHSPLTLSLWRTGYTEYSSHVRH